MDRSFFLRNLWRWKCGLPEEPEPDERIDFEELRKTEWAPEFEQLMRNRLLLGSIRYGKLGAPGKPQYDRIAASIKRLRHYEETGNLEMLVDVANFCLLEFVEGRHPNRHLEEPGDAFEKVKVK